MMPCFFTSYGLYLKASIKSKTNNSYHLCFDKKNILAVDDEPDMTALKVALERAGFDRHIQ
jgi:hypothetical protein